MTTPSAGPEAGLGGFKIPETGDYLVVVAGRWYYWLSGGGPPHGRGPYPTRRAALDAYKGGHDDYSPPEIG